jgi:hypothetical protein
MNNVDTTNDIAAFLTSRRAKITPERAGLPTYGKRRVPGLLGGRRTTCAFTAPASSAFFIRSSAGCPQLRGKELPADGANDTRNSRG